MAVVRTVSGKRSATPRVFGSNSVWSLGNAVTVLAGGRCWLNKREELVIDYL